MVQEYGRYFGIKTGVFRGGCLTGPAHSAAQLHGFLAYLVHAIAKNIPYMVTKVNKFETIFIHMMLSTPFIFLS